MGSLSSLPVGVSVSAGVSVAPAVGAATSGVSPWVTQTEKEAGRGASQEASRFPRAWASFLAHPQEMNSSCFAFLNFPPLPSPLSGWAPNPSLVWLTPKPYNISGGNTSLSKGRHPGTGKLKAEGEPLLRAVFCGFVNSCLGEATEVQQSHVFFFRQLAPLPPSAPTSPPYTQDLPRACGEHLTRFLLFTCGFQNRHFQGLRVKMLLGKG